MDFSRVQLSDDDRAFLDEARDFLRAHVTDDVLRRDRETGDNFNEGVHLALGAAGYLARDWKPESDGGFNRVRRRIWELAMCGFAWATPSRRAAQTSPPARPVRYAMEAAG
jgi:alkylation response protein AidB-like acyl-CoA dehydrogenase